jgi:hypothetical protein
MHNLAARIAQPEAPASLMLPLMSNSTGSNHYHWTSISTNVIVSNSLQTIDPAAGNPDRRFYFALETR